MIVARVTKVKKGSNIVDASVRQVSGHRKQERIRAWKNEQKASKLLELVSKKSKIKIAVLESEIQDMRDTYGSLYLAFEAVVIDTVSFKKEWKGKWLSDFIEVAIDNITPPHVSIGGMLDLVSYDVKGAEKIRKALMKPKAVNDDTTLKITSNGSPSYRISIKAPNYKQAEDELKKAVDLVLTTLKSEGGIGSFERS